MAEVFHQFGPASREIFSSKFSFSTRSGTDASKKDRDIDMLAVKAILGVERDEQVQLVLLLLEDGGRRDCSGV